MSFVTNLVRLAGDAKAECFQGTGCSTGLPTIQANNGAVQTVMQIVFGVLGGVALLFILVGAFYMISAQGEPQKVATARQTVIYAVIGLAVAVSAEAIVTFVIGNL